MDDNILKGCAITPHHSDGKNHTMPCYMLHGLLEMYKIFAIARHILAVVINVVDLCYQY